jgi:hypothetical protein
LLRHAYAERWLGLMVALPTVGSEADEVGLTGPCAATARGEIVWLDRATLNDTYALAIKEEQVAEIGDRST